MTKKWPLQTENPLGKLPRSATLNYWKMPPPFPSTFFRNSLFSWSRHPAQLNKSICLEPFYNLLSEHFLSNFPFYSTLIWSDDWIFLGFKTKKEQKKRSWKGRWVWSLGVLPQVSVRPSTSEQKILSNSALDSSIWALSVPKPVRERGWNVSTERFLWHLALFEASENCYFIISITIQGICVDYFP